MTSTPPFEANSAGLMIGVDIGASKIHGALFSYDLDPIAEVRVESRAANTDLVTEGAVEVISRLIAYGANSSMSGIGVGVPGCVDLASGMVRHAVNLGVGTEPVDIIGNIRHHHDIPLFLENDVNAAALGVYEIMRRTCRIQSLTYLNIGTGVRAGVILNGDVYRGRRGVVGEIGHFPAVADGPECVCGLRGCIESLTSGRAIEEAWRHRGAEEPATGMFAAARAGVSDASAAVADVARHLARLVYLLAVAYDTECTVIGGGVARAGDPLIEAVVSAIQELEVQSEFVASLNLEANLRLEASPSVGALGAAAVAKRRLIGREM